MNIRYVETGHSSKTKINEILYFIDDMSSEIRTLIRSLTMFSEHWANSSAAQRVLVQAL
jgi:hypothetical protein